MSDIKPNSDNKRSNSAHTKNFLNVRSTNMDTNRLTSSSASKDQTKSNDVKSDMVTEDVIHANNIVDSPSFLRIPLKPIEYQTNDEQHINEKRFVKFIYLNKQFVLISALFFIENCVSGKKIMLSGI